MLMYLVTRERHTFTRLSNFMTNIFMSMLRTCREIGHRLTRMDGPEDRHFLITN